MDISKLGAPLDISQIDFRVQNINKGGYCTILAYKNARADMDRLDQAVGPLNWKREHSRDNHNCTVSIWNVSTDQWVSKEDTGTESSAEAQKGLASDSFKRACFNWGIGRELYSYPLIQVKLNSDEFQATGDRVKATWKLKLKEWVWKSQFVDGSVTYLAAWDEKGKQRFTYGTERLDADTAQSAPQEPVAPPFTVSQKETYLRCMADNDGWGMKLLAHEAGPEVMEALFSDAPKGEKTKQKQHCREIVSTANAFLKGYIKAIEDACAENSESGLREIFEELSETERFFVDLAMPETLKFAVDGLIQEH